MSKKQISGFGKLPEFDEVSPNASAMIESMRAHGYTLPAAIADLIDNSIAAHARNVWLVFEWDGDNSWISITDDGEGMTEPVLVNAMRLGSKSPLEQREETDLGRFGLGLKTASFSQARRLTVTSRPEPDQTFIRRWDLDHLARSDVQGWQLLKSAHPSAGARARMLDKMMLDRGTQVLLEETDRVTGKVLGSNDRKSSEDHFLWQIDQVRDHLAMVFHRFLARNKGGLRIFINDEEIVPWDPFLPEHKATIPIGPYSKKLGTHGTPVKVTGFVLPHRDRFKDSKEHQAAGGPEGWNAQQGFYLYRGDRLIIAGDWLQLGWQKEEHFKLARICLVIPISMDLDWQIDVKKSTAAPPAVLRKWLKGIAQAVRKEARSVYSHRGKYGARKKEKQKQTRPWVTVKKSDGEFSYRIDRKHPVIQPLIRSLSAAGREELEAILRLVEETVPVQRIWIDTADNQDGVAPPFAGEKDKILRSLIETCHLAQTTHSGLDDEAAWDVLAAFDGFQDSKAQAIIGELREGSL